MTSPSHSNSYLLPKTASSVDDADRQAVMDILGASQEDKKACIAEFEEGIGHYCNAPFAVFFSSMTSALYAAAAATKVSSLDRLLVAANTPMSQVAPFLHMGARPTLIDIDPATGLMDLEALKGPLSMASSRGKTLVLASHFAGIPLDLVHLESLVKNPNTVILEDASSALGSISLQGDRLGSCTHSDLSCVSLTCGSTLSTEQGGLLFTSQENIYHHLLQYRESSQPTSMQAALGLSQLRKLDIHAQKRSALATLYQENLKSCPHTTLIVSPYPKAWAPGFLQVQCDLDKLKKTREEILDNLQQQGIQATPPPPAACQKIAQAYDTTPHALAQVEQSFQLPFYPAMDEDAVKKVCHALKEALESSAH